LPLSLQKLSAPEAARLLAESLVVLPTGSLEQHCNAPLGLDAMLAEALAWRACERLEEAGVQCVIAPPLAYGFSPEWTSAPGTVSIPAPVYVGLVKSILVGLARSGARRAAIVNGHAGNSGLLEAAAREAVLESPSLTVAVVDYWRPAGARLGHCTGLEERLARELLGLNIECKCPETLETPPYRAATGPHGLAGIPSEARPAEEIVASLAKALLEASKLRRGDPLI